MVDVKEQSCSPGEKHHWGLGQEINRRLPNLSGVTVAPAAVIVLPNRRRKSPIRTQSKESFYFSGAELRLRGAGLAAGGTNRVGRSARVKGSKTFTFFLFL